MKAFMFVVVVAVFAMLNTASAQILAGDATMVQLDLTSSALTVVSNGDIVMAPSPGQSYHFFWNNTGGGMQLDPLDAGGAGAPGDYDVAWTVSGAVANQNVVFTFSLPTTFVGEGTGAQIPITYGNADAIFEDGGTNVIAWNPHQTSPPINLFAGGGGGTVHIGFAFSVPFASPTDTYDAVFYLAAQATGF
jgi:hypothetical protein